MGSFVLPPFLTYKVQGVDNVYTCEIFRQAHLPLCCWKGCGKNFEVAISSKDCSHVAWLLCVIGTRVFRILNLKMWSWTRTAMQCWLVWAPKLGMQSKSEEIQTWRQCSRHPSQGQWSSQNQTPHFIVWLGNGHVLYCSYGKGCQRNRMFHWTDTYPVLASPIHQTCSSIYDMISSENGLYNN